METREELLAPLCAEAGGVPIETFADWDVVPYYLDGAVACTAIVKGTEIHFYVRPEARKKLILRSRTQEFLRPLMNVLGFLTTRVLHENKEAQRFVERIGFEKTWADNQFQFYILERLPFSRSE